MPFEFRLPDIGEGVVDGEVVAWHVKEGDTIVEDQPLVEVMTDKATVVIPSPKAGKILKCHGKEGEIIKVGAVVVEIEAADGSVSAPSAHKEEKKEAPKTAAPAPAQKLAPAPAAKPAPAPAASTAPAGDSRNALATPSTRKLAREMGVDISSVSASGPHGRVTKGDIENASKGGGAPAKSSGYAPKPIPAAGSEERIPFRGLRRKIAEKMTLSKSTATHFTYVDEVDMTELVKMRASLKGAAEERGVKLTYIPFIIKALIPAFRSEPIVNSVLDEASEQIVLKHYYNIGIAVDTDDGLVVPVVKRCETKSLLEIAADVAAVADRARNRKLSMDDIQGGTFTITSVGNLGGMFATPIINVPEVAILGVNRIEERPVVRNGVVVIRSMMYLAISLDHRVVDGAVGARFLNEAKKRLENPGMMLLDSV